MLVHVYNCKTQCQMDSLPDINRNRKRDSLTDKQTQITFRCCKFSEREKQSNKSNDLRYFVRDYNEGKKNDL